MAVPLSRYQNLLILLPLAFFLLFWANNCSTTSNVDRWWFPFPTLTHFISLLLSHRNCSHSHSRAIWVAHKVVSMRLFYVIFYALMITEHYGVCASTELRPTHVAFIFMGDRAVAECLENATLVCGWQMNHKSCPNPSLAVQQHIKGDKRKARDKITMQFTIY